MNKKLYLSAITKFLLGVIIIGIFLFIPAGSFNYWNAWLFIALLFIPMFIAGIIMMIKSPNLLKSRLDAKEKEKEQKIVVILCGLMFLVGFVIAGLNYRFNWIFLPNTIVIICSIVFIISYILYAKVLRENVYLSRTIEVQENQKVIDTGLYRIVRHPMYLATLFMFLSIPLILNSLISFIIFLVYPFIIGKRISNEEKVLGKELDGYKEYKKKVKYKMLPFIY